MKVKLNYEFNSSAILITFQVLSNHIGLVLGSAGYRTFPSLQEIDIAGIEIIGCSRGYYFPPERKLSFLTSSQARVSFV